MAPAALALSHAVLSPRASAGKRRHTAAKATTPLPQQDNMPAALMRASAFAALLLTGGDAGSADGSAMMMNAYNQLAVAAAANVVASKAHQELHYQPDNKSVKKENAKGTLTPDLVLKNRRENHRAVERRRRDHINIGIEELARIVPGCQHSKGKILHRTNEYIRYLLAAEQKRSRHELRVQFLHNAVVSHLRILIVQLLEAQAKAMGRAPPTDEEIDAYCAFNAPAFPPELDESKDDVSLSSQSFSGNNSGVPSPSHDAFSDDEDWDSLHEEAVSLLQLRNAVPIKVESPQSSS